MSRYIITAAIIAGILVTLPGCSEEKAPANPPRPVKYSVARAMMVGEDITQTGEVRPRMETPMSFRLGGQLTFRGEIGKPVEAGDIIAKLDRVPSGNGVLSAKADLATAMADLELAEVNAERNRGLFDKNIASKAQLQQAEAALATATAKRAAAEAALASAEDILSYTDLKATQNGVVSAVGANEGQVVSAGQMIVTVISNSERDAVFDVPEKLVGMDIGDPVVEITLLSDPAVKATGRVREVTPSADPATRTYRIKVALDEAGQKMPFGSAVTGSLILNAKKLVQLPASALTESNGKSAVFVIDPAAKVVRYRNIQVERYADATVLVAEGLTDGDLIATSGVTKLRDGESVLLGQGDGK